jgi:hypothetical protein
MYFVTPDTGQLLVQKFRGQFCPPRGGRGTGVEANSVIYVAGGPPVRGTRSSWEEPRAQS